MINSFLTEETVDCDEKPKPCSELDGDILVDNNIRISITKTYIKHNMLGIELENGDYVRGDPSIEVITSTGPKKIIDLTAFELVKDKSGFIPLLKKVNIMYYSGSREIACIESKENYYVNNILINGENNETTC
jgi:hypothetical protein